MSARRALPFRLPQGRRADAALAACILALTALASVRAFVGPREEPWARTLVAWAMVLLACGALCFLRRAPVPATVVVFVATAAYYLGSVYDGPLIAAPVVALYGVAAGGRLRSAVGLGALAVIGTGAGTLGGNDDDVNGVALFLLAGWVVAVVALGWVRHTRLVHVRERELRAVTEERLRIARELHDAIGHHISLVNVQAGAALHRFDKDPGQAGEALGAIKESSRAALRELRATLGVLRQADETAPTDPVPGLARVGELADAARAAGLTVRVETGAGTAALPTEVDLAAYRIVQESLTNAARHARADRVTVRLGHGAREVTVEVEDDGHGPPPGHAAGYGRGEGSGITGMRERARALGGDLTAGPGTGGGFAVRARFPHGGGVPLDTGSTGSTGDTADSKRTRADRKDRHGRNGAHSPS